MQRMVFALCMALSLGSSARAQTNVAGSGDRKAPAARVTVRPMPPEIVRRSESLHASLRPSARSWVSQQALIEERRPTLDLDALRSEIRRRFAGSLSGAAAQQNMDIDTLAFTVLTEAAQSQDQDLQNQMLQMQAAEKEKQTLRQLQNEMQQEIDQMKAAERGSVCQTSFCRSLPARLAQMTTASAAQPRPFRLRAPENITYPQLSSLLSQTNEALGSVSDMSQNQQLQLQTIMDQRTKLLEALSNILKSMSDTDSNIISNMK